MTVFNILYELNVDGGVEVVQVASSLHCQPGDQRFISQLVDWKKNWYWLRRPSLKWVPGLSRESEGNQHDVGHSQTMCQVVHQPLCARWSIKYNCPHHIPSMSKGMENILHLTFTMLRENISGSWEIYLVNRYKGEMSGFRAVKIGGRRVLSLDHQDNIKKPWKCLGIWRQKYKYSEIMQMTYL